MRLFKLPMVVVLRYDLKKLVLDLIIQKRKSITMVITNLAQNKTQAATNTCK